MYRDQIRGNESLLPTNGYHKHSPWVLRGRVAPYDTEAAWRIYHKMAQGYLWSCYTDSTRFEMEGALLEDLLPLRSLRRGFPVLEFLDYHLLLPRRFLSRVSPPKVEMDRLAIALRNEPPLLFLVRLPKDIR